MNLKGVLIDFGDTLAFVDRQRNREYVEGLLSILKKYGHAHSVDDLASFLDGLYYRSSEGEFKSPREFWTSLLAVLKLPGNPQLLDELEWFRLHNCWTFFSLYDGVVDVLSELQPKYKLALVSNCAIGMSDVVKALGIDGFFQAIVLSYEVGIRKPDERIYVEALRRIGLEPIECVFVADEISDLEGARAVGLRTLLVRQGSFTKKGARNPEFKPDFQCSRVTEVTGFL